MLLTLGNFLDLGTSASLTVLAVFFAIIVAIGIYFVVWALRRKPVTGVEAMKGQSGVAVSDITESGGEVSLDGVVWRAKLSREEGIIPRGANVVVVDVSSLTLMVRRRGGGDGFLGNSPWGK